MQQTAVQLKKVLGRRYHTLCNKLGMEREDRNELLQPYGVTSSLDLSARELEEICNRLDGLLNPKISEGDQWRKRVMASIGAWLRLLGQEQNGARIRAIACRASGYENFNAIPPERLRNLYYAFLNKQKDFATVSKIAADELDLLSCRN